MDDFAVARRRLLTQPGMTLDEENVATRARQGIGDGKAHDPAADDDHFDVNRQSTDPRPVSAR
jgi:hypothetical protein